MTNTRLTDPEVLEFRYPVVLEDFHIRKDSGGRGQWNAGDGIRRTIRFLEKMECTILSGHRRVRPFGLAGGEAGQVGENAVRRKDGRIEQLKAATPPCSMPAKRSSSRRRPRADMAKPERSRRHLNAAQKRALKAAAVRVFMQKYGRKAQRGVEPNDRRYDRDIEKVVKKMTPAELDKLLPGRRGRMTPDRRQPAKKLGFRPGL